MEQVSTFLKENQALAIVIVIMGTLFLCGFLCCAMSMAPSTT